MCDGRTGLDIDRADNVDLRVDRILGERLPIATWGTLREPEVAQSSQHPADRDDDAQGSRDVTLAAEFEQPLSESDGSDACQTDDGEEEGDSEDGDAGWSLDVGPVAQITLEVARSVGADLGLATSIACDNYLSDTDSDHFDADIPHETEADLFHLC